jgi:hypothetical protein
MIIAGLISCGTGKSTQQDQMVKNNKATEIIHESGDTIRITNEKLEYEIIIIESGFESWLVTQKPMWYYSEPTLEIKNYRYVNEWNNRVRQPNRYDPRLYEQIIDYDPHIHYGLEVNYKLYMYFKFFEQKYHQRLTPYR